MCDQDSFDDWVFEKCKRARSWALDHAAVSWFMFVLLHARCEGGTSAESCSAAALEKVTIYLTVVASCKFFFLLARTLQEIFSRSYGNLGKSVPSPPSGTDSSIKTD
jgi:hypothetical protein